MVESNDLPPVFRPVDTNSGNKSEQRWHIWAEIVSTMLGWPRCTGLAWDYVVCDRRDEGGNLEMVHIDGHSDIDIYNQIERIKEKQAFRPKDNRPVPTNPATYEKQDKLQAYGEYRAHGGKLDLVEWQEKEDAGI